MPKGVVSFGFGWGAEVSVRGKSLSRDESQELFSKLRGTWIENPLSCHRCVQAAGRHEAALLQVADYLIIEATLSSERRDGVL